MAASTTSRRKKAAAPKRIYQLKVTLNEVRPEIWRRLQVRETCSLGQLHHAIQIAMGWENSHLHMFVFDGRRFGDPRRLDIAGLEAETIRLNKVLTQPKQRMFYEYDFGDSWHHQIALEAIEEPHPRATFPKCLAGAHACPPEDVGGPPGYAMFLEAMRDPRHAYHGHYREWWGGRFDPKHFPLTTVNKLLQPLRR
jgi:hypothetical protein